MSPTFFRKDLQRQEISQRLDNAATKYLRDGRTDIWHHELVELRRCLEDIDDEESDGVTAVERLRDHTMMRRGSEFAVWPPIWATMAVGLGAVPHGEIGYLQQVLTNKLVPNAIYLEIRHEGRRYMGALSLESATFCGRLCTLLDSKIGHSIKEIGGLML